MVDLAKFNISGQTLLVEIDNKSFFYPEATFSEKMVSFPVGPKYLGGIIELDNDVCIVVDLMGFLVDQFDHGDLGSKKDDERVFVKIVDERSNTVVALVIPMPEVIRWDGHIVRGTSDWASELPYEPLVVPEFGSVLYFEKQRLVEKLTKELTNFVEGMFLPYFPKWDRRLSEFPNPSEPKELPTMPAQVAELQNVMEKKTIFVVGSHYFSVDEENVKHIMPNPTDSVPLPNSPDWIVGTIDFEFETIAVVDLAQLLQIESKIDNEWRMAIVLEYNSVKLLMVCDSVFGNVPQSELDSLFTPQEDPSNLHVPFGAVYAYDNQPVFQLNVAEIYRSVDYRNNVSPYEEDIASWAAYLSSSIQTVVEKTEIEYKNEELATYISGQLHLIAKEKILFMVPAFEKERREMDGELITSFGGQWIPSFSLSGLLYGRMEEDLSSPFVFSVILQTEDGPVELLLPDLRMVFVVEGSERVSDAENLNNILEIQLLDSIVDTTEGRAVRINIDKAVEEGIRSFCKNLQIESKVELQSLLPEEPPLDEFTFGIDQESLFEVWRKDTMLYLVVEDKEQPFALPGDAIVQISLQKNQISDVEIVPWTKNIKKPMYIELHNEQSHLVLEAPPSGRLVILSAEDVIKDEEDMYIAVNGRNIPIWKKR